MPNRKRLVVCCDGTWNDADDAASRPTNVARIARAVLPLDSRDGGPGIPQIVSYSSGVGTTGGSFDRLLAGAVGLGLARAVRGAYAFIAENYCPGDEIFLFGFSRGAYTVRSVAGLIGWAGLLRKRDMDEFVWLWEGYRATPGSPRRAVALSLFPERHREVPVQCLGVWDTVGALGILAINDAYGTGLQKVIDKTFTAAGGKVVATEFYNTGDTNFTAQISSIMAQKPDAIMAITFDEALTIIPALKDAGFDTSHLYLSDGNLKQYGDQLPAGVMTGAQGTTPGPVLPGDFQKRVKEAYAEANNGKDMGEDYSYAGESYDAVILIALAALAANSVKGADIATKLQEVSGGSGNGEKATDFKSAATIINSGGVVDYDGYSGGIKFDEHGDPTEASIGIFKYDDTNHFTREN